MSRSRLLLCGLPLLLLAATFANADTLTFDAGPSAVVSVPNPTGNSYSYTYTEGAMTLYIYGNGPIFDPVPADQGGGYKLRINFNSIIVFEMTDNSLFNVTGFDFSGGGDTLISGQDSSFNPVTGASIILTGWAPPTSSIPTGTICER